MDNILDGLQCFYKREKLANEIEQSASEDQKYNALHISHVVEMYSTLFLWLCPRCTMVVEY